MAEREGRQDVLSALESLGAGALSTATTDGINDEDVNWVSPEELIGAARRLRDLVLARDPRVALIIDAYSVGANGVDPVHEEFAQDLVDVAAIGEFAQDAGVTLMTLEVNW